MANPHKIEFNPLMTIGKNAQNTPLPNPSHFDLADLFGLSTIKLDYNYYLIPKELKTELI